MNSKVLLHTTAVVDRELDGEEAWKEGRAEGVTATEVAKLIGGGIRTRRSILETKLDPSKGWQGNAHANRGKRRESIIAEWAARRFNIQANSTLWAHETFPLHRATPDALGVNFDEEVIVGEYKSTTQDWSAGIPRAYLDQIQWQMHVTGALRCYFIWERVDELDQPYDLEPFVKVILRDETRIAALIEAAESFIAWREAGAPTIDVDIDEQLDEAISRHVAARAMKAEAEALEKAAEKDIRAAIEAHGKDESWKVSGSDGEFTYSVSSKSGEKVEFDTEAMRTEHPVLFRKFATVSVDAARLRTERPKLFERYGSVTPTVSTSTRLAIAAHGKAAGNE